MSKFKQKDGAGGASSAIAEQLVADKASPRKQMLGDDSNSTLHVGNIPENHAFER